MLDYEWGNPSSMLLSGEEPTQDSDQTHQILDHYNQNLAAGISLFPSQPNNNYHHHHHHHHQSFHEQQQQQQTSSPLQLYDPRTYSTTTTDNVLSYPSPANNPTTFLPESMAAVTSSNFMMMPKNENICGQRAPTTAAAAASIDFSARIGLNLGGRTYFSSEDDFVNRFYRRSRHLEPGPANVPRCQAEGCNADLTHAKHYHRRHKVCEFHSKASTVLIAGITQRFCQQCSRFHLLTEFDQGKRSCRKRLADHNRRRRKSNPQPPSASAQQQSQLRNTSTTTTDQQNPTRSSPDSGGMHSSSSSVTVAMPHMECHSAMRRA